MSSSPLGLSPVPSELKPILPYLQRAEELKKQDPIVSYWCAYYAAQVGISLKARDSQSRDMLFELLGSLEKMKAVIGPNDAVDIESVSSAYVENFALKVFANADNEDRSGRGTRSTAKKFLASANFLEVLKIFPKADISESTEEKIRYSKWKAADIAKAFREGRKPTPGPPGWAEEQEELRDQNGVPMPTPPTLPPTNSSESTLISSSSPPRKSSLTSSSSVKYATSSSPPKPHSGWSDVPSETWSTAATPGTDAPSTFATPSTRSRKTSTSSRSSRTSNRLAKTSSGTSAHTIDPLSGSARGSLDKSAWTTEELEGKYTPSSSPKKSSLKSGSPDSDKRVHFTPGTIGAPPALPSPPKSGSSPKEYTGPESIYHSLPRVSPPAIVSPPVQTIAGYPSVPPPASASSPGAYIYAPSPPVHVSPTRGVFPSAPPPPPPPSVLEPFELTTDIVTKAQKRCRYAISALDYEDVETARRELRAALALLGA